MGMISKANEKFAYVIDQLGNEFTCDEFIAAFIDTYPKDWEKVVKCWNKHKRQNKGKKQPMPEPRKYLMNVSRKVRNS